MPPKGIPPLSLIGLAFTVVMVSKQAVKVTDGVGLIDTGYRVLGTGFRIVQVSEEVKTQETKSPFNGM